MSGGGARPSIPHVPALDGLRGAAVVAVVAFHFGWLPGGWLGVDAFFTLSGYLITSLLLAEATARSGGPGGTGRIDLRAFWRRRVRRLQPAALVAVLAIVATAAWWAPAGTGSSVWHQALAALGSVANWQALWADHPYAAGGAASAFEHFWSLAIEEQFYVVWPLVVAGVVAWSARSGARRGGARPVRGDVRGTVFLVAVVGLVVSWAALASHGVQRAYLGTDGRIGSILVGCALAAASRFSSPGVGSTATPGEKKRSGAAGHVALAALVVSWAAGGWPPRVPLALLLPAHALLVAVVLVRPPQVLAWRPLAGLGRVSYGVYLWHWPVLVLVTPEGTGLHPLANDVVRLALTAACTWASWRLVEHPVRSGRVLRRTRPAWALAAAAAVAVAAVGSRGVEPAPAWATADGRLVLASPGHHAGAPGTTEAPPGGSAATVGPAPTSPGSTIGSTSATVAPSGSPRADATAPGATSTTAVARDATPSPPVHRVLVVGDSLPTSLMAGDAAGSIQVGDGHLLENLTALGLPAAGATVSSCPVVDEIVILRNQGPNLGCPARLAEILPRAFEHFRPDVVLWYSRQDGYAIRTADGTVEDPIDDPAAAARLRRRYADRVDWFAARGARVVFVSPGPNEAGWDRNDERNDSERSMAFLDEQLRRVAAEHADDVVGVLQMREFTSRHPDARPDDGLHFARAGAVQAGEWLARRVADVLAASGVSR